MDVLTKEQRRRNMQTIKSRDTKDEVLLAKTLWKRGWRYLKNDKSVFGKPDIVFKRYRIAIFVDSEYFHGKDWETEKYRIKSNRDFWWPKIEGNVKRDILVSETLRNEGWTVLRFWSREVRGSLDACILKIEEELNKSHGDIYRHKEKP